MFAARPYEYSGFASGPSNKLLRVIRAEMFSIPHSSHNSDSFSIAGFSLLLHHRSSDEQDTTLRIEQGLL